MDGILAGNFAAICVMLCGMDAAGRCWTIQSCAVLLFLLILPGCVSTGSVGIITKSGANPAELLGAPRPPKEVGQASARAC
jgi:hypothetical protein